MSYAVFPDKLVESVTASGISVRWHIHYHGPDHILAEKLHRLAKSLHSAKMFDHRVNRGLSKSWNESLSTLDSETNEVGFIFNDDLYFKADGFRNFYEFVSKSQSSEPDLARYYTVLANEIGEGALADVCPQGMACCAINAGMIKAVGFFDEDFHPAYFEDCDYFRRMKLAGYEFTLDSRALCVHERSLSSRTDVELSQQLPSIIARNRAHYLEKWGGEPDNEVYTSPFNRGDV